MEVVIREGKRGLDDDLVWQVLKPSVEAGDTFCAPHDGGQVGGLAYFWSAGARLWLAEIERTVLGCYYLKPNQTGNGDHICNAGYCTLPAARGKGVARQMLAHSLDMARDEGYRAMQYNFVVATNTRAIAIWEREGFDVLGRLPGVFRHPQDGFVDALVMFRTL